MQNLWRLILLVLLCGTGNASEVVRLVTWNLDWFPGRKPAASAEQREEHFREVAAILPQFRADIIVLQEVRDDATMQRLAALMPGYTVHVTSTFKDSFSGALGQQQISIISRYKADGAWAEPWKRGWANAPRGYAYARLLIGSTPLHVYGLHLKSNLGNPSENTSKREDAIEQLVLHTKDVTRTGEAVVVCGDFNTSKDEVSFAADGTLKKLEGAGFFWTFEGIPLEQRITIPGRGRYPDACFDHIYTRNLGRPVASPSASSSGSDHLPVLVDLIVDAK